MWTYTMVDFNTFYESMWTYTTNCGLIVDLLISEVIVGIFYTNSKKYT